MKNLDFEWLTDEFMLYCRSTQLREKTMSSYEQTLHLFGRWLADELKIYTVDKISENVIRKYIDGITCGLLHNISFLVASWQLRFVLGSLPFNYCFGRGFCFLSLSIFVP